MSLLACITGESIEILALSHQASWINVSLGSSHCLFLSWVDHKLLPSPPFTIQLVKLSKLSTKAFLKQTTSDIQAFSFSINIWRCQVDFVPKRAALEHCWLWIEPKFQIGMEMTLEGSITKGRCRCGQVFPRICIFMPQNKISALKSFISTSFLLLPATKSRCAAYHSWGSSAISLDHKGSWILGTLTTPQIKLNEQSKLLKTGNWPKTSLSFRLGKKFQNGSRARKMGLQSSKSLSFFN